MSKSVNIIGAGGHSRPIIQLLQQLGYSVDGVYDESYNPHYHENILGVPLKGVFPEVSDKHSLVLAIGSNEHRKLFFEQYRSRVLGTAISHPSAIIEPSVQYEQSNIFFARSYLSALVRLGMNNIINAGAIIEHESVIGNHCHISVGALICGRVRIGDECFIGAGAVVRDKISIASKVNIGAGAVVIKDISEPGTYIGNPAKKMK